MRNFLLVVVVSCFLVVLDGDVWADEGPPPRIELWTMGQGEDVFERFGHGALCVFLDEDDLGRCYNYGTTNFTDPVALVLDFLAGRSRFWVSVESASRTLASYQAFDRSIWVQRLPLGDAQARSLAARLEADLDPSRRYYMYEHFRDNCTTRLRDHIDAVTGGALRADSERPYGPTFRQMVREGFSADVPILVLTELLPARTADARPTIWQAMFHPDVLRAQVAARLGAVPELVAEREGRELTRDTRWGRVWIVAAALGLVLVCGGLATTRRRRIGAVLLGVVLTVVSLPVWWLVLGSQVPDLKYNEAALVFMPLDVILVALPWRLLRGYLAARLVGLGVVLLGMAAGVLVQPLLPAVVLAGLPMLAVWGGSREA